MTNEEKPTCLRCGAPMIESTALENTVVTHGDFPGDTDSMGCTQSATGPARLIPAWKCPKCGHSVKELRRRT